MRVLFITTSFPRHPADYAGSFIFRLAKCLRRQRIRVCVVAPGAADAPAHELMEDIEVRRPTYFWPRSRQKTAYDLGIPANLRTSWLARVQLPLMLLTMWFRIILTLGRVDVVHCHWLPTVWLAWSAMLVTSKRRPIIFTNWGSDTRLAPPALTRLSLRLCDALVSTAAETDAHFIAAGRSDFHSIMAPVDEVRFKPSPPDQKLLRELGIGEGRTIVTFVGRLDHFKDPLTFIRAIAELKAAGADVLALVVGDGALRAKCEQEIRRLDATDRILMIGMRDDPERFLSISRATVHISPVENTWANVIAEAMFMQVPVIMTRAGHTESTFTDGMDCLMVRAQDPTDLATTLKRVLEDRVLADRLADGACELLRRKGKDSNSISVKLASVYREIQIRES